MSRYELPIVVDVESLKALTRKLDLEECWTSSYRRSWMKERARTKAILLKMIILYNDAFLMVFKNALLYDSQYLK